MKEDHLISVQVFPELLPLLAHHHVLLCFFFVRTFFTFQVILVHVLEIGKWYLFNVQKLVIVWMGPINVGLAVNIPKEEYV